MNSNIKRYKWNKNKTSNGSVYKRRNMISWTRSRIAKAKKYWRDWWKRKRKLRVWIWWRSKCSKLNSNWRKSSRNRRSWSWASLWSWRSRIGVSRRSISTPTTSFSKRKMKERMKTGKANSESNKRSCREMKMGTYLNGVGLLYRCLGSLSLWIRKPLMRLIRGDIQKWSQWNQHWTQIKQWICRWITSLLRNLRSRDWSTSHSIVWTIKSKSRLRWQPMINPSWMITCRIRVWKCQWISRATKARQRQTKVSAIVSSLSKRRRIKRTCMS